MKKIAAILLTIFMVTSLGACSKNNSTEFSDNSSAQSTENESGTSISETEADSETEAETVDDMEASAKAESEEENIAEDETRILVAYFSCTNTTRPLVEYAADSLNADLYEIVPAEPYTDADLDYHDDNSRSTIEMNDPAARPAISGSVENMEQYDIVFIGYPIWLAYHKLIQCTQA